MASLLLIRCLNDDVASALYTIQDARTRGEWVGDVAVDSLSVYNNEALRRFRVQMVSTAQTGWDLVIRIDAIGATKTSCSDRGEDVRRG